MIPSQRDLFDIPRDRVYLNTAYMGPMPKTAIAAGQQSYAAKGRPWDYDIDRDFFGVPPTVALPAAVEREGGDSATSTTTRTPAHIGREQGISHQKIVGAGVTR